MAATDLVNTPIPGIPQLTGNTDQDVQLLYRWITDFHRTHVHQTGLLDPARQFTPPASIDHTNPPDPANSSIAIAQATANAALAKAFGP